MKGAGTSFQLVQTCRQTGLPCRWVQTPKQRPQLCNLHAAAALTLCCPAGNNAHVKNKQFKTDVLPVGLQADRAEKCLHHISVYPNKCAGFICIKRGH